MATATPHLGSLEDRLGYHFNDVTLLSEALTHSSYSAENRTDSYERLEFLGDAVLELATTKLIFETLPDAPEGEMTKLRAAVVDKSSVASVGRELGVPEHIRLGVGEDRSAGRERESILSDVVEAILGAVFVDGGWTPSERLIRNEWAPIIAAKASSDGTTDPRSRLQEMLAKSKRTVVFTYQQSGPDHAVEFSATALVDGEPIGIGSGSSKKLAAIDAARAALDDSLAEKDEFENGSE